MASPYTQDISKTVEANRKRNKPSYSSQLISVFKQYENNQEARAKENIKKLNTDFVFEKQALNNKIKGYNEILAIQEDVNENYGGSTLAYAEALANKQYQNRLAQKLNAKGQEGFQIFNDYTAVGADDYLSSRTQKIKNDVDTMFKTAKSINLGGNVNEDYVDSLFTQEINNLPTSLRGSGWGALGSLISGQGLKIGDTYDVTRQDILERVYSDIPEKVLGELGKQFQAYYTENPANAEKFAKIVPNIKFGTEVKLHDTEKSEEFLGRTRRYHESYYTYTDKDGNRQISSVTKTPLNDDELFIDAGKMAEFLASYSLKGQKIWNEEHKKGTPLSDIVTMLNQDKNNFVNKDEKAIKQTWFGGANQLVIKGLYDTWAVGEGYAEVKAGTTYGKTVVEFKEGASEKEGYLTFEQYKNQNFKNELRIFDIEQTGTHTEMGYSTPIKDSNGRTVAYVVDSTSYSADNTLWNDSIRGTNMALFDKKGKLITLTQELTNTLELDDPVKLNRLQSDFDNNINEEVTTDGLYFNKTTPFILDIGDLTAIGIEASEPIEFGYDIKNEQFVMRSTFNTASESKKNGDETGDKEKITSSWWDGRRDPVEFANDIPYVGAITETLFSKDLDKWDSLWLIPAGVGALRKWGSPLVKAGGKYGVSKILSLNSKFIKDIRKHYRNKDMYLGKGNINAYNEYVKSLGPIQKSILLSFNKAGTKVSEKQLLSNLLKTPYITLLMKSSTNTLFKYGAPAIPAVAAQWVYGDEEEWTQKDETTP